jgi:ribosome-associated translation inhibitor RaiA
MKLSLTHRHHQPSPSFTALVKQRLEALREALQIDEARVLLERRLEGSPAFRVTAHLVTPGPDLFADGVDHTLRAALDKMIGQLEARIDHRQQKRTRRGPNPLKKTAPAQLASIGSRL